MGSEFSYPGDIELHDIKFGGADFEEVLEQRPAVIGQFRCQQH